MIYGCIFNMAIHKWVHTIPKCINNMIHITNEGHGLIHQNTEIGHDTCHVFHGVRIVHFLAMKNSQSMILAVGMMYMVNAWLIYGAFHKWGYPHSWMVYFRENPIYKWMMTGGKPYDSGNPKYGCYMINDA